jgi:hypothetical protein
LTLWSLLHLTLSGVFWAVFPCWWC